jgi:hypothetical protein
VREENHTQKKIFTSYRRSISCSRWTNSFVAEDILPSVHLLLPKISFLGTWLLLKFEKIEKKRQATSPSVK